MRKPLDFGCLACAVYGLGLAVCLPFVFLGQGLSEWLVVFPIPAFGFSAAFFVWLSSK